MSNDELAKLYAYMDRRFNVIEQKLDKKLNKTDVEQIAGRLAEIYQQLDNRGSRHEIWIKQLAKKTNTPLAG